MPSKLCNTGSKKSGEDTVKAYPSVPSPAFTSVKTGEDTVKAAFTAFPRYLSQGESVKAYSLLRAIETKKNEKIGNIEGVKHYERCVGDPAFTAFTFWPQIAPKLCNTNLEKELTMRASKSKEEALSRLGGTPTAPELEDERVDRQWGERLAVFAECMEWLEGQRRKHDIDPLSEEFAEVMEAMTGHRDYLNEQWHDGDDETFKESLRRYMRACAAEMGRTARRRNQTPATQESLASA